MVVPGGPSDLSEGDLQALRIGDGVYAEKLMDSLVGGDEGQAVRELEALLRERAAAAHAGGAQRGLVNELKCQARFDPLARLTGPTTEQLPSARAQVLGDQ